MNMEDYIKTLKAEGTSKEKIAEKFALELEKAFEEPKNPYTNDTYTIYKNGVKSSFVLSNILDMLMTYYSLANNDYAKMNKKEIENVRKNLEKNVKIFFDVSTGNFDSFKKELSELDKEFGKIITTSRPKDSIEKFLDDMGF